MTTTHPDYVQQFHDVGYVVVEDVFDPATDFAPLYADWHQILDNITAQLIDEGRLDSQFKDLPFDQRLRKVATESKTNFSRNFDIALPQKNIKFDTPIYVGPGIFGILTSPKLLDVVERIVGPEILCNPVGHVRMKLPDSALTADGRNNGLSGTVPFHQDQGVLLPEADDTEIISVWVAVSDATEQNGCLRVIPGSHRSDLLDHCTDESFRGSKGIASQLLPDTTPKPLPMRAGSALIFPRTLIHGALDNVTDDQVRISLDLRYQPADQPTGRSAFPGIRRAEPQRPVDRAARLGTMGRWLAEDSGTPGRRGHALLQSVERRLGALRLGRPATARTDKSSRPRIAGRDDLSSIEDTLGRRAYIAARPPDSCRHSPDM